MLPLEYTGAVDVRRPTSNPSPNHPSRNDPLEPCHALAARSPAQAVPRVPQRRSAADRRLDEVLDLLGEAGGLTGAEREVLEGLLLGRAYAEIATMRGTSPHTVGVQVRSVLRRLGAANSRDLFRIYLCELDRHAAPDGSSALGSGVTPSTCTRD